MKSGRLYGNHGLSRRTLLRGLLGGAVVTIGLPPLERFLNANGTAYAASGDDGFPRRFGLFFWGNGILPARWTPTGKGTTWELSDQLAPLAAMKSKITVVSGTKVGVPNSQPHGAGAAGVLSGMPLLMQGNNTTFGGPSIDHAVWFETPIRVDDWVQLRVWPVKAGGSRGLYHGAIRDQQGRLGATLAQEMLLRGMP